MMGSCDERSLPDEPVPVCELGSAPAAKSASTQSACPAKLAACSGREANGFPCMLSEAPFGLAPAARQARTVSTLPPIAPRISWYCRASPIFSASLQGTGAEAKAAAAAPVLVVKACSALWFRRWQGGRQRRPRRGGGVGRQVPLEPAPCQPSYLLQNASFLLKLLRTTQRVVSAAAAKEGDLKTRQSPSTLLLVSAKQWLA